MEFSEACTDMEFILQNMEEDEVKKIPQEVIETISFFKLADYETKINLEEPLETQNLSEATKALITYIYKKYLGTEEERIEYEKECKLHGGNELFAKNDSMPKTQTAIVSQEKKESMFSKIINKIRAFLHLK